LGHRQLYHRGTEDVPGFPEGERDLVCQLVGRVIFGSMEEIQHFFHVIHAIERFPGRKPFPQPAPVLLLRVFLVHCSRILEHYLRQLHGGRSGDYRAAESEFVQLRYEAAVVYMRMSEKKEGYLLGIEVEGLIIQSNYFFGALEHAAVYEYLDSCGLEQIARTRDHPGRSVECKFHDEVPAL